MPKKAARRVRRAEVMSELQSRLLGDIERALRAKKMTKVALEDAGGPSQQVLDKWAHGASPTLRTLESLADALNSELIVAIPGVSDPPATVQEYLEGHEMPDDAAEIVDLLSKMDEKERAFAIGYLRGKLESRRPHEPAAGKRSDRVRSSASSGPTT